MNTDVTVENTEETTESQATATAPETAISQETLETDENQDSVETETENEEVVQEQGLPFSNGGKEKFSINGKEVEWDWETTKRYAQKGYAGMQALQRAAETEKKARQFSERLFEAATADPVNLIRTLRGDPTWSFHPQSGQGSHQADSGQDQTIDPRDEKISELEQKLSRLEQRDEQTAVEAERRAIAEEISKAEQTYPAIKGNKFAINYIKSEYAKALRQGLDVTIDDVAFYVAQELQESSQKKVQEQKQRIEQKRKQSPVVATPAAPQSGAKEMSMEDVKKLAGLL